MRSEVCPFALLAEQAEELDRSSIGSAEPVRQGVELDGFTGRENQAVLTQDEP